MGKTRIRVAVATGCASIAFGVSGATAKKLDSDSIKAKPGGIPTRVAAVSQKGKVFVTISTKKGGRFKERDRDRAEGLKPGANDISVTVTQAGDSYEKNGGEGLLSAANYANYFRWNAKQGRIYLYN